MRLLGASASTAKTSKWPTLCMILVGLIGPWVSALPMKNEDSLRNAREQWNLSSKPSGFLTVKASTTREPSPQPAQTDVPTSFETSNDPEPCATPDYQGTSPDAFLPSENMRRLIGDLATCRDDLFALRVGEASLLDSSDKVVINKSHWRSCREALFTLIRWLKQKREERALPKCANESPTMTIPWSRTRRAYPPPMGRNTWQTAAQVAQEDVGSESTYRARCKERACDFSNLSELCSQPKKKLNHWDSRLCAMCYPPNEEVIERYCAGYSRSEGDVYVFLIGLFLTFVGAAATLVWIRHWREKRRIAKLEAETLGELLRKRTKNPSMQESRWRKWDPREWESLGKFSQRFRNKPVADLEDRLQGMASGSGWTSQPLAAGVAGPTTQQMDQHNLVLYHELPLMPKAQSSGIQTPVGAAAAAHGSLHQRFASADGIETLPRVPLYIPVRSSSSRKFGSSP